MSREIWLYVGLGAAVGYYLFSRTETGQATNAAISETIGDTVGNITSGIRGIRNNNPGNIDKNGTQWQGMLPAAQQTDSRFIRFSAMQYGIRAIVKVLRTYQNTHGLNTVRKIINRWAPPVENNTDAYVNAVARKVGVSPDTPVSMGDAETVFQLVRAIIAHENGAVAAALISDATVYEGINLA